MAYDKFHTLTSTGYVLHREDIDTDQIIPARFLKATERKGFGQNLFADWRYDSKGKTKTEFVLNQPEFSGSKILVAGKNFGCGSSREHAAWALYDFGLRCVVSSFFADIFRNNALNNGLLPVEVSPAFLQKIFKTIKEDTGSQLTVDLPQQRITLESTGEHETFEISAYKKNCLLNGLDDIEFLINMKEKIDSFEKRIT